MKHKIVKSKHGFREVVTGSYEDIIALTNRRVKGVSSPFYYIGENSKGEHMAEDLHFVEQTQENKMAIRNRWNADNPEYCCCVACGRALHEHNKDSHYESKLGIIGPECFKKFFMVLHRIGEENCIGEEK